MILLRGRVASCIIAGSTGPGYQIHQTAAGKKPGRDVSSWFPCILVLTVQARRCHSHCLYVRVRESQNGFLRLCVAAAGALERSTASGWMARGGAGRAAALGPALRLLLLLGLGLEAAPTPAVAPTQVQVSGE